MLYRLCDLVLRSNVPLPELPPAAQTTVDVDFELLPAGELEEVAAEWFHRRELDNGRVWLTFGRLAAGYLLRFPRFADFTLLDATRRVRCRPRPGLPEVTLRHLLVDQVLPLVLSQRGALVLHASAVAIPQGVLAFVGETGRGKSTLAASLCQRGCNLVTDDYLVLRERGSDFWAMPTYPGLRVMPATVAALFEEGLDLQSVAHYTQKKRVGPDNTPLTFQTEALPLRRLFFLDRFADKGATVVNSITRRDAFFEFTRSSVSLDCQSPESLQLGFLGCNRLAGLPFLNRLAMPRDFALLPAVCDAILGIDQNDSRKS
jgi:hypothetical protein